MQLISGPNKLLTLYQLVLLTYQKIVDINDIRNILAGILADSHF
jgi:hypothetical protein